MKNYNFLHVACNLIAQYAAYSGLVNKSSEIESKTTEHKLVLFSISNMNKYIGVRKSYVHLLHFPDILYRR